MTLTLNEQAQHALATVLDKQCTLYRQLDELSQRQSELIAESRSEELLGVLARRQRIIGELGRINGKLAPFRRSWEKVRQALVEPHRSRIESSLDEVRRLLDGILARDARDTEQLGQQKQQVGNQMRTASQGRAVHQAYAGNTGSPQQSNRFVDYTD